MQLSVLERRGTVILAVTKEVINKRTIIVRKTIFSLMRGSWSARTKWNQSKSFDTFDTQNIVWSRCYNRLGDIHKLELFYRLFLMLIKHTYCCNTDIIRMHSNRNYFLQELYFINRNKTLTLIEELVTFFSFDLFMVYIPECKQKLRIMK